MRLSLSGSSGIQHHVPAQSDGAASPRQPDCLEEVHGHDPGSKASKGFRRERRVDCEEKWFKKNGDGKLKRSYWSRKFLGQDTAQLLECLPCVHKAVGSTLGTV